MHESEDVQKGGMDRTKPSLSPVCFSKYVNCRCSMKFNGLLKRALETVTMTRSSGASPMINERTSYDDW